LVQLAALGLAGPLLATRSSHWVSDRFGQSGDIPDLYRASRIDTVAILDAAAGTCLTKLRQAG
jgi:pyruvate dehydrogenase E1 component